MWGKNLDSLTQELIKFEDGPVTYEVVDYENNRINLSRRASINRISTQFRFLEKAEGKIQFR
ncbi:hypothetical protein CMV16_21615 [Peribacillus simplex]|nr:hypothetical protein CMV16_21615 [Peribacillus simplex]